MIGIFFKVLRRCSTLKESISEKWFLIKHKALYKKRIDVHGSLRKGKMFSLVFDASDSYVQIGQKVLFRDFCQIRSGNNSRLIIGNNVFFNNGCTINCYGEITIGNNNQFGENVKFYDVNHNYKDKTRNISEQGYSDGKIIIGNNCWIGANVIILRNVTIGDNVIIGASCLIHTSIPSDRIVHHVENLIYKEY